MTRVLFVQRLSIACFAFGALGARVLAAAFDVPVPDETSVSGMMRVERFGSGPRTLVLIPGLSCGTWVWSRTIAHLSPAFTVYAVTLAGFDGVPPAKEPPRIGAFEDDFWQWAAKRGVKNPVILGHSLGGTLAIALAEDHPERLSGLVAIDGLPVFPTLAFASPDDRAAQAEAAGRLELDHADQALANEIAYMGAIGTMHPDQVASSAALEAKSDPNTVAAWLREDLKADLRPALMRVSVPFLEIAPYNPSDNAPPRGYSQTQVTSFYQSLLAGAPKAQVIAIAPSRHFVMIDQPEALERAIDGFLGALASKP